VIEPPLGLSTESIVARVRDRYMVDVHEATFLPVGNDSTAWSYRLDGDGRWFLKVFGRPLDAAAVEVPRFLAGAGIDHLIPSISTVDGQASDASEPFSFVVFPYVEAEPGGADGLTPAHRTELGRFLRAVHDTQPDDRLRTLLRRERFVVRDEAYVERVGARLDTAEPPDAIATALLGRWREHGDDIARTLRRARELAAYGRSARRPLVICHADFHAWNVLVETSGAIHIVDWDEVVYAPPERDLMFVSGDIADIDPAGGDFSEGYGEMAIDRALIAYYRFDWVLQELADYHRRVFDPTLGERTRAEALAYFVDLFGPEDVVAAAFRADDEIG
jgi:spectinomycin phosphotransferase